MNARSTYRWPRGMPLFGLIGLYSLCFLVAAQPKLTSLGVGQVAVAAYFVVATLNDKVVGYQFNALDSNLGYLVRIAVHPSVNGQGIGARLMAEAVRFFQQEQVSRIMLNTQDTNTHAHSLYEWFGFIRIHQQGFVLRKPL